VTARIIWTAGLSVAAAAAIATAHGSYEVATAAGVPAGMAVLYPAIGDGLALVAYATTTRLDGRARRYAWTVVVLTAGLSGLAQAAWLAGGVHTVPSALRFGVGAWPAIAAAVVAHLLVLLADNGPSKEGPRAKPVESHEQEFNAVQPAKSLNGLVERDESEPASGRPVDPDLGDLDNQGSAGERARVAALAHLGKHGALPTVSQLVAAAGVARGTAATALRQVRTDLTASRAEHPNRSQAYQRQGRG
jgi:hypothetical protein